MPSTDARGIPTIASESEVGADPGRAKAATNDNGGSPTQTDAKLPILLVEHDPADVELMLRALRDGGFALDADVTQTADGFTDQIRKNSYDVILADYNLPSWNGMETVEVLRREGLDIPVVLVTGSLGERKAVECIKLGASDYVLKDNLAHLPEAVRRATRESKLRKEHRQAQEELARSNRELEQFAYIASHDLQEPLRMVAIYTQLLAERYQGKLDADADKYIRYAVDGAVRMQTFVRDLLAFSRVGKLGTEHKVTDCNAVVATALQNLQAAIHESGARVEQGPLPELVADGSQLLQLFQNLIGNAIKFRGAESPTIGVVADKRSREWVFSVSDNGIGIAPESVDYIFQPFKRLHTHEEYTGSGIGLAICKKIIEQHDGRIWVESNAGRGSTFRFTIPTEEARGKRDHTYES